MKKLALIVTICILLALVFAPSHLALAGSTFYADPLTQGGADNTGEPISDLTGDEGTYYDVLGATTRKVMEIVTFTTNPGTTINHARLHIQYYTDPGYPAITSYVQWNKPTVGYQNIIEIATNASDTDYYYEFPRSYIDTWTEIGAIQIKLLNDTKNKNIYVDLLEIIVTYNATFASYSNDARTTACEDFDDPSEQTVYMLGTGFEVGEEYKTAYYKDTGGLGSKVDSDITEAATGGTLDESLCNITAFYDFSGTQTWKAVVFYPATEPAPSDYAAALTSDYYVIDDTFMVYVTIPEFPTIMASIAVAGLCFGIYYWMRKRRLAYVKA